MVLCKRQSRQVFIFFFFKTLANERGKKKRGAPTRPSGTPSGFDVRGETNEGRSVRGAASWDQTLSSASVSPHLSLW